MVVGNCEDSRSTKGLFLGEMGLWSLGTLESLSTQARGLYVSRGPEGFWALGGLGGFWVQGIQEILDFEDPEE